MKNEANGASRAGYVAVIGALTALIATLAANDHLVWAVVLVAGQLALVMKMSTPRPRLR